MKPLDSLIRRKNLGLESQIDPTDLLTLAAIKRVSEGQNTPVEEPKKPSVEDQAGAAVGQLGSAGIAHSITDAASDSFGSGLAAAGDLLGNVGNLFSSAPGAPEILGAHSTAGGATTGVLAPGLQTGAGLTGGVGLGGIAAGATTGLLQAQGAADLLQGKDPSLLEHAALFPLTGGFSAVVNPARELFSDSFGSGKNPRQQQRDSLRDSLRELLGPNNTIQVGGTGRRVEVERGTRDIGEDKADLVHQALGLANPIAFFMSNGSQSHTEDLADLFAGGAVESANNLDELMQNLSTLFTTMGVNENSALSFVERALDEGFIDQATGDAYLASLDRLYGLRSDKFRGNTTPSSKPLRIK